MTSSSQNPDLIFGRFSREECGLPAPAPAGWRARTRGFLLGAALFAGLWAAGWLAGTASARNREAWIAELPARVAAAGGAEAAELLAAGRLYARALPNGNGTRRNLAVAALLAAEKSPWRMGYYGNAINLFAGAAPAATPLPRFAGDLAASGAYAETNDYPAAFAALARAETALSELPGDALGRARRLALVNAQAYYLATAPMGQGRDAAQALRLAGLLVTSRDALPDGEAGGGSAAFLDTLACAQAAAGRRAEARGTQTLALGLAGGEGLDVYVEHFDEFDFGRNDESGRDAPDGE